MKYPALMCLLAVILCQCMAYRLLDFQVDGNTLLYISYGVVLLTIMCLAANIAGKMHGCLHAARWGAAMSIGFMLAVADSHTNITTRENRPNPYQRARIEGQVIESHRSRTGLSTKVLLDGELDTEWQPSCRARCVVTISDGASDGGMSSYRRGTGLIVFGNVHKPYTNIFTGGYDEFAYASMANVAFTGYASREQVYLDSYPSIFDSCIQTIQEWIRHILASKVRPDTYAVLLALVLGDDSEIPRETKQLYASSGTIHMFSVSGSHVALVITIVWTALFFIRNRTTRLFICAITVVFYVVLSGSSSPAWRAACMGLMGLYSLVMQIRTTGINTLSATILAMLIYEPSLIYDVGFQLSVTATAGIIVVAPALRRRFQTLRIYQSTTKSLSTRSLLAALSIGIAAASMSSIICAYWFGVNSMVSPIANLAVVPLLSIEMVCGFLMILLHVFIPDALGTIAWCCDGLTYAADTLATTFGMMNPRVHVIAGVAFYVLIIPAILKAASGRTMIVRVGVCTLLLLIPPLERNDGCSAQTIRENNYNGRYELLVIRRDSTAAVIADLSQATSNKLPHKLRTLLMNSRIKTKVIGIRRHAKNIRR